MKKEKKTPKGKPQNNKGKNQKNQKAKKPSKILPIISRLMPYILAVLFVLMLFTIVRQLSFSGVLYGIFSTYAPIFVLAFLLFHSLMWYYDTNRKICTRRICCSVVIVLCVSVIQHLITLKSTDWVYKATETLEVNKPTIFQLYESGKSGIGGGVIGGGLCGMLLSSIGKGFTIAIILIVLLFMFLQMFNITPASIIKSIFREKIEARKARREEAKHEAMLRKKHKKFRVRVFDEEDDDEEMVVPAMDERIIRAMEENDFDVEEEDEELPDEATDADDATLEISRQPITAEPLPRTSRSASPYRYSPVTSSESVSSAPVEEVVSAPVERPIFEPMAVEEPVIEEKPVAEPVVSAPVAEPVIIEDEEEAIIEEPIAPEPVIEEPIIEEKPIVEEPVVATPVVEAPSEPIVKPVVEPTRPTPTQSAPVQSAPTQSAPTPPPPKPKKKKKHVFPPIDIFENRTDTADEEAVNEELQEKARIIVETLKSFNISTRIVDISRGPTVTRYELMPEAGVKVRSIANHIDDISLYLAAEGIRIECPIPGKMAVGIEVPNSITSMVYLRSLLEDSKFKQAKSPVTCAVGKDISGENVYVDIAKLVHLLVAGATGQGKSVCINSLLVSLLYKASPDDLRLILIDPKRVEFAPYNGIPHLLVPVVTDVKKSVGTLQWSVTEMERRFELLEIAGVRDIGEYNDRVDRGIIDSDRIPRIVIVIDELYDLKMQVPEIDDYIIRLTQKARAAGIHVIIGTQRPSVDVITGVIKANIPSRIAFRVPAQVDSRTILDEIGAEKLVARGDMLLKPVGALKPTRVQGAFITEDEREAVTTFLRENAGENYDEEVIGMIESNTAKLQKAEKRNDDGGGDGDGNELDEKFYAALEIAVEMGKISSSYLQRKLNLGFQRAARIIDQMEDLGYIGEPNGSKPREVLITKQDFLELMMRRSDGGEN